MAGIKFDFTIGDENFKQKLDDIRQSVSQTAKVIDDLTQNGFDTSTMESRVQSLETVIQDMEQAIGQNVQKLEDYQKQAQEALNVGDYATFDVITKDMEDQMNVIQDLEKEADVYRDCLNTIQNTDLGNLTGQLGEQSDAMSNTSERANKYKDVISALPAPIKSAVTGFGQLVKAAKAFLATPIGAVIGALTVALGALRSYLTGSAEGQMKLAKASGYVKGVLTQMKEGAIQAGKAILDAFKDPKQAVSDLWESIKQNLINRLNATKTFFSNFGSMMKNLFKGNWDEMKEDAKAMGEAFIDMSTGVEDTLGKASELASDINEKAQKTAELSVRQRKNDIARYEVEKKIAMLDEEMAEQREKMYSTESSIQEKREAVRRTQEIIAAKYADQIKLAQEDLAIARQKADLSTNDQETFNDIKEKETAIVRLQAQRQRELASLARRSATFAKQELAEAQNLIEFKRQIQEDETNMMKDSYEKRIKLAEIAYDKEIDALEKQREQMELVGGGTLTAEQLEAFNQAVMVAYQKFMQAKDEAMQADEDAMDEYLIKWGTMEEKRLATRRKYEKLINEAGTEGARMGYQKELDEELLKIEMNADKGTSVISKMFADMKKKSIKDLKDIKSQAKMLFDMIDKGKYDAEQGGLLGIDEEMFNMLINNPESMDALIKAFEGLTDRIEDMQSPLDTSIDGLKELFDAGGDRNLTLEALNKINSSAQKITQGASYVADAMASIGTAIDNEGLRKAADDIRDIAGIIDEAGQGAAIGGQIGGGYGAIIGAVIGLGKGVAETVIKNVDAVEAASIERVRKHIRQLAIENEQIGDLISKSYSTDKSRLIEKENELLKQQEQLVQKQLEDEKSKKNSDQSAIEGYEDQLREINKQIEANKEAAIDAIIGSDIKSAISDFTSRYMNAWEQGQSKALATKEFVSNLLKQTVQEAIKAAVESSEKMKEIRAKVAEYMTDGILESWEQQDIEKRAEAITEELDKQFGWADSIMKKNVSILGTTGRTISTMTQETGEALEGRFTSVQMTVNDISQRLNDSYVTLIAMQSVMTSQNDNLSDMLTQLVTSNTYLEDIRKYTLSISKWKENIEDITDSMEGL